MVRLSFWVKLQPRRRLLLQRSRVLECRRRRTHDMRIGSLRNVRLRLRVGAVAEVAGLREARRLARQPRHRLAERQEQGRPQRVEVMLRQDRPCLWTTT